MDYINHQSTGAQGLRIAASICIIIGWICLAIGLGAALAADRTPFYIPLAYGLGACAGLYVNAFVLRALATIAEAAEAYYINLYGAPAEEPAPAPAEEEEE